DDPRRVHCSYSHSPFLPPTSLFSTLSALSSVVFFFFYCSGDHRDLHSFPTRRSSDLRWRSSHHDMKRLPAAVSAARPCVRQNARSEEHTSELQSRFDLVCRLLLEKKKNK